MADSLHLLWVSNQNVGVGVGRNEGEEKDGKT